MDVRPAVALGVWTMLVWTTRIRNIWTDDSLTTSGQIGRTLLAAVFTGFAFAALWLAWRGRRAALPAATPWVIVAFAGWTTVVWIVRGVQIALADHSAAFIAVHSVLALVSIGLAGSAWRAVRPA